MFDLATWEAAGGWPRAEERGFGALLGIGGNALVRDFDEGIVAAGNAALTAADELSLGALVLLSLLVVGSVDAGIFDSKASRDMAALPSAKASGVVPNFAWAV